MTWITLHRGEAQVNTAHLAGWKVSHQDRLTFLNVHLSGAVAMHFTYEKGKDDATLAEDIAALKAGTDADDDLLAGIK